MSLRGPGYYAEFQADVLSAVDEPAPTRGSAADSARLIVTVYNKLGLLKPGAREQLGDILPKDITELNKKHEGEIEPFLAINLTNEFGLRALVARFDAAYQPRNSFYGSYWDSLDIPMLNRRTIGEAYRPIGNMSLRGAVMRAHEGCGVPGLTLVGMTSAQRLTAAQGMTLHSPADWLVQEALRREAGLPSLDTFGTSVCFFPQQRDVAGRGDTLFGSAYTEPTRAVLRSTHGMDDPNEGARYSVGLDES